MKKVFVSVLIFTMCITGFAACGGNNEVNPTPTAAVTEEPTITATEESIEEPTEVPTLEPTAEPTATVTIVPTETPVATPTKGLTASAEPEIEVGEYKGITLVSVSKDVLDAEISAMLESYSEMVEVSRAATEGDTVTIDFVGLKDGVAFEGGTAEGYNLILGSGSFIDGFEDGLIGAVAGEKRDLNLTFPENYGNEELAGQAVVFQVTVQAVMEERIPELTDEFIAGTYSDYATVAEFTEALHESLNTQSYYEQITEQLMASSEVKQYDEERVAAEQQILIEQYKAYAAYYGSYYGLDETTAITYLLGFESMEAFEEEKSNYARDMIKNSMVIEKIAELENFAMDDETYKSMVAEYAAKYGYEDSASFEAAYGGEETVRESLLAELVMKCVIENAVIVETQ